MDISRKAFQKESMAWHFSKTYVSLPAIDYYTLRVIEDTVQVRRSSDFSCSAVDQSERGILGAIVLSGN